jgi:hypothetical protein
MNRAAAAVAVLGTLFAVRIIGIVVQVVSLSLGISANVDSGAYDLVAGMILGGATAVSVATWLWMRGQTKIAL